MGSTGKNPHDALVRDTFGQPERAGRLLEALLPSAITEHLELGAIELTPDHLVDEKLRELESDLLYRVPLVGGGEAFLYVLLEHQSTVDRWMPLRLLKYIVRIWDRWQRSVSGADTLPPIVPIVLSHAPGGWTAAKTLVELVDGPESLVDALGRHLPSFEPVIEDLARRSDEQLRDMNVDALSLLVLLLLKHIRDGDILERLPGWSEAFRAAVAGEGIDALVRVLVYIFECVDEATLEDIQWIDEAVETPAGEVTMTLAEKLRQEGRQEGRLEGRQEGRQEGRLEGWQQQQLKILRRQLELRFGDLPAEVVIRLEATPLADLELMAERVLAARSLAEVLDPPS